MTDRDRNLDRLLREAMEAATGPVRTDAAECLDVETLAAWSEGRLDEVARARAESHAAACTRCQGMLAAMVRTAPIVEPAARTPFRKWLVILGPALATAAAVTLWVAVDRRSPPASTLQTDNSTAFSGAARSAPPAPAELKDLKKEREADSSALALRSPDAEKRADLNARVVRPPEAVDRMAAARVTPRNEEIAPKAAELQRFTGVAGGLADGVAPGQVAGTAPGALPPAPRQMDQTQAMQRARQDAPAPPPIAQNSGVASNQGPSVAQNQAQNRTVTAEPSRTQASGQAAQSKDADRRNAGGAAASGEVTARLSEAPPPPPVAAPTATGTGARAAQEKAAPGFTVKQVINGTFDLPTSNAAISYRILEGRTVQRSTDTGETWTTQYSVVPPALLVAGAAPTPVGCWLVGRAGLVLRTTDGRTWQRITFPETTELKAISAFDINTATVIAADGRTFTTSNGGRTWTSR